MSKPQDYAAIAACRADDEQYFERYPEREYRLRRADTCEYFGVPHQDQRVFAVVHRDETFCPDLFFVAPFWFQTQQTDAQIAEILKRAAQR